MIIDDEHKYIFIHIPKVAGESIKNKLGGAQLPHHLPAKGIQQQFPAKWNSYYKFSFVRNPLIIYQQRVYNNNFLLNGTPIINLVL